LITAAKRFDERREFRFISYAVWWVRQSIQKALAEQTNTVRLPINRTQQAQKMRRAARVLEQERGRKVNDEEIAVALSLSPRNVRLIRAASRPLVSIDESAFEDELTLANTLSDGASRSPDEGYLERELKEKMSGALRLLSSRERGIVVRYYGLGEEEPASLERIGQGLKLSRERVRQIRNSALAKIRRTSAGSGLVAFL